MGIHVKKLDTGMLFIVRFVYTFMHVGPLRITGGNADVLVKATTPSGKPKYLFAVDVASNAMDGQKTKLN
jgi:hypothetical protein